MPNFNFPGEKGGIFCSQHKVSLPMQEPHSCGLVRSPIALAASGGPQILPLCSGPPHPAVPVLHACTALALTLAMYHFLHPTSSQSGGVLDLVLITFHTAGKVSGACGSFFLNAVPLKVFLLLLSDAVDIVLYAG